ncbi:protein CREG1 [Euwallacea fornicatus]|uniref:protein CREG1 n=1 Tax=Euwallacea fornicatus TaxID=995702 RepID=UPI00338E9415
MNHWKGLAVLVVFGLVAPLTKVQSRPNNDESTTEPTTTSGPPPFYKYALMARYIIHLNDWVSIATISTQTDIEGYPFVGLKSLSDGTESNSTGIPYIYMSDMDVSGTDLLKDKRVTIMSTLAQSEYCKDRSLDPQDPQCAKVIITGTFIKINNTSEEYQFGEDSLFERHPAMKSWPKGHDFYVSKVKPEQIIVLDFYGGAHKVTPQEYFDPKITAMINLDNYYKKASVIDIKNNAF